VHFPVRIPRPDHLRQRQNQRLIAIELHSQLPRCIVTQFDSFAFELRNAPLAPQKLEVHILEPIHFSGPPGPDELPVILHLTRNSRQERGGAARVRPRELFHRRGQRQSLDAVNER
jgi:hypothetical protein